MLFPPSSVSIWQTQASLKAQMERSEAKLQEVKASCGEEAMMAAKAQHTAMHNLTNVRSPSLPPSLPMAGRQAGRSACISEEWGLRRRSLGLSVCLSVCCLLMLLQEALRSSPSTEADDKAPAAAAGPSKLQPSSLRGPSSAATPALASPKVRPSSSMAGNSSSYSNNHHGGGGGKAAEEEEEDGGSGREEVLVKRSAGPSAAKSLGMNTKVALPHHLEPLQVRRPAAWS